MIREESGVAQRVEGVVCMKPIPELSRFGIVPSLIDVPRWCQYPPSGIGTSCWSGSNLRAVVSVVMNAPVR